MRRYNQTLSPIQAIRNECLDCMGAADPRLDNRGKLMPKVRPYTEVRECTAEFTCALWPYRMGTHPARSKKK